MNGVLPLSADWQWLGSQAAVITLGVATVLEVLVYFIPGVSNVLDSLELIAAPVAGMIVTASSLSMVGDLSPVLVWTTATIAGGGTAELVEGATTVTRLATTGATGGLASPVVGLIELLSSVVLSILAILAPIFTLVLVIGLIIYYWRRIQRFRQRHQREKAASQSLSE